MRILGVGFFLIDARLFRQVLLAVASDDIFPGSLCCLVGDAQRVGSHIGNQTHSAQLWQVDTFIQLLCRLHGSFCLEAQTAGCLLLKGGGDERRCGHLLFDTFFDFINDKIVVLQLLHNLLRLFAACNLHLFPFAGSKAGSKDLFRACGGKLGIDGPVFLLHKVADFLYKRRGDL